MLGSTSMAAADPRYMPVQGSMRVYSTHGQDFSVCSTHGEDVSVCSTHGEDFRVAEAGNLTLRLEIPISVFQRYVELELLLQCIKGGAGNGRATFIKRVTSKALSARHMCETGREFHPQGMDMSYLNGYEAARREGSDMYSTC